MNIFSPPPNELSRREDNTEQSNYMSLLSPVISVSLSVLRTFQILSVGCPCWITCQETKQKDPDKEKDDRIDGNLEGKHESDQLNRG